MTLGEMFTAAGINKIGVVDDDFRKNVTLEDIKASSANDDVANILKDSTDPTNVAYVKLLTEHRLPIAKSSDLENALSIPHIQNNAPARIKAAIDEALRTRKGLILPVEKIINVLEKEGIDRAFIHTFSTPEEIEGEADFDMLLIDYYLVENSTNETIKLIKRFLEKHADREKSLLLILMSSHTQQLHDDFSTLRQRFSITASRLRILNKPITPTDEACWIHTFEQLASERSLVPPVESFIKSWGKCLQESASEIIKSLWELDIHSLDILRMAAEADHMPLTSYLAEILSRKILAEAEEGAFPRAETLALENAFCTAGFSTNAPLIGAEVADSRRQLRELIGDTSWHRKKWWHADSGYPGAEPQEARHEWIRKNIRFGTVLRNRIDNALFLIHITQPCDIAHIDAHSCNTVNVLLLPGSIDSGVSASQKESPSYSLNVDDQWLNITWSLVRPRTMSLLDLREFLLDWVVIGQLRPDFAQELAFKYAAQAMRVATIRTPRIDEYKAAVLMGDASTATKWLRVGTNEMAAFFLNHGNDIVINFSATDATTIASTLSDDTNGPKAFKKLISGVRVKSTFTSIQAPTQVEIVRPLIMKFLRLRNFDASTDFSGHLEAIEPVRKINIAGETAPQYVLIIWKS